MRVIEVRAFGGPERLEEAERPLPVPGPGEVRIRIRAAGFNPVDYKWRQGLIGPVPVVLGREVAGVVEAVGEGAAFRPGDEVFAYAAAPASNGGYAEALCVTEALVARKPACLSFAEAAAVPIAGLTAYECVVVKAQVARGEAVLVAGGAGGVGSAALALLRHLGAGPILATAGSDASEAHLHRLGVREVIRYDRGGDLAAEISARGGVAAAFDFVGGAMKRLCFDAVVPDGRVVSIVEEPPDFPLNLWDEQGPLMARSLSFHFVQLGARGRLGPPGSWAVYGERLAILAGLYESGALQRPLVEVVGPLSADTARRAHVRLEAGHVRGKLVMEVHAGW